MNKKIMEFVANQPLGDLGMQWCQPNASEDKYVLTCGDTWSYGCVWKMNAKWGCRSGNLFSHLEEAQSFEESKFKAMVITRLKEINHRMEELKNHFDSDNNVFSVSAAEYTIFHSVLSKWFSDYVRDMRSVLPKAQAIKLDDPSNNILHAFDYNNRVVVFWAVNPIAASAGRFQYIPLSELRFSVDIGHRDDPDGQHQGFVSDRHLSAPIKSFSENDLETAAIKLLRVANHCLKKEGKSCPVPTTSMSL